MKTILILGTGGNCIDILDTINEINLRTPEYECIGFLDDDPNTWGTEHFGIKTLGPLEKSSEYDETFFVNGIGSTRNYWKKEKIILNTQIPIDRFETIVHPSASVSKMSRIGRGTVVFQNVTITSNANIGNHVVILPNSVISHDCIVGDYTCIAGGVCISSEVSIGDSCYLGSNVTVRENVRIGRNSLIGMGSNVLSNVDDSSIVYGNPASSKGKVILD